MPWKQLTERDRREWKLSAIDPHDRDTWRTGVRSAMRAALLHCIDALLFYVHGKHLRSCRDGQLT